ncbi:Histidine kinase-, DNA gyrase B-, and HSP90-like ATPase [Asanoa hainanensis]|uniref:Histidine kinase-, DNA gyrase B-, and HSP90-like ATPase n=1 Tax=Asanoa hainanensis TaxID=560556 RepID=A0A239MV41_9ACTN|nr:Histidine kinase-, DNA gyrase B-, and HSP90-like ATPase [Asanoa hainanensis]
MSQWREDVPTEGSVHLPPDAHALDGIGRNHSLETALADLIDNAIDASATEVVVRFVQRQGKLRSLYLADNGHGIAPAEIDSAMTVGGRRDYHRGSLGKFGLGMKAASFSQARSLTVLTRTPDGVASGRRWHLDSAADFRCDIVAPEFVMEEVDRDWGFKSSGAGGRTVIRWDDVTGFTATDDRDRVQSFLTATITKILNHLGLVLHRFLAKGALRVFVDVEDVDRGAIGARFEAEPLNPFGYHHPGNPGYPKILTAKRDGMSLNLACHIWPGRSKLAAFKLPGGAIERQGLYFYRADRLLHAGGWDGLTVADPRLQLARIAIDITDDIAGLFSMNPEKSRITVGPDFAHLIEAARSADGSTIGDYLRDAESTYKRSRERSRDRRKMLPPGKGFEPSLKRAIGDEIPFVDGEEPVDIRWRRGDGLDFFVVDRESRTIWLNDRYRQSIIGEARGGLNDAPLVKALLYLLIEDVFRGEYLGAKDKDNIALWQEVLTAAVRSQLARSTRQ